MITLWGEIRRRRTNVGPTPNGPTPHHFFNSEGQLVTNWSGAWASSLEWFSSRRLPRGKISNEMRMPGEARGFRRGRVWCRRQGP
jgi:hypothetical protein